jgi:dipeptidyl aminopeptidase/acylaminoacyl peptidase
MRVKSSIIVSLVALGVAAAHAAVGSSATTRWIVFSALPKGLPPAQLFRVQTDGAGLEQVTTGTRFPATDPEFSPNGKRVVFARLGSGIFVADLDGKNLRRLTRGTRDHSPVWSPDGSRIAFLRVYNQNWRVYVMKSSGSELHRLAKAPPAGRPTWSANSKSIFIPADGTLGKFDARTGKVQTRYPVVLDPAVSKVATVSPNGKYVAFIALRPSAPTCGEVTCNQYALFVSPVAKEKKQLIGNGTSPAGWTDSTHVVYVARGALYIAPVAGAQRTKVTVTGGHIPAGDAPPTWQPR